ncbi:hypothetical protein AAF712_015685 [Marasmius tenuissimus]|uniref:Uncharacterized protein n=1 Tax=Marasmius tenuissimus TaxID=585030 RepID=A0ABR2ZB25_9AGAR
MLLSEIQLSHSLHQTHRGLRPALQALIAERQMGGLVKVTTGTDRLQRAKGVSFLNVPGVTPADRISLFWMDAIEATGLMTLGSLSDFVKIFRDRHGQTQLIQRTVLFIHGDHRHEEYLPSTVVDDTLAKLEMELPCVYRTGNTVEDGARVILNYMHALHDMVSPVSDSIPDVRRQMLMTIPAITEARANLVFSRYPTFRELQAALNAMRPEVEAGRVTLNRTLFTGEPNQPGGDPELWVRNLYVFCTDRTGTAVLWPEEAMLSMEERSRS